jgi:hypothetical protein
LGWLALLALPVACKTGMTARKDAGQGSDARAADALPDQATEVLAPDLVGKDAAAPDQPTVDLGGPDSPGDPPVRQSFRFDNHTDRIAYVRVDTPVDCLMQTGGELGYCSLFGLGCLFRCADLHAAQSCCVSCEPPEPALYAIPPGGSRTVPWTGNISIQATGLCSECTCQQEVPASIGRLQASATIYTDYWCGPMSCQTSSDGIISMANPRGPSVTLAVSLVPTSGNVVVIDITSLPATDAAVAPEVAADLPGTNETAAPDLISARESGTNTLPVPFGEIAGGIFQILASATPADASALCRSSDPNAVYNLYFSTDGSTVDIVHMSSVAERVIEGTLKGATESQLSYSLDFATGGELLIQRDSSGRLVARFTLYGSGLPIVLCIDSPMTRVLREGV